MLGVRLSLDSQQYHQYIEDLIQLCQLPPEHRLDVRTRLFSDYDAHFAGRNIFGLFAQQRYEFVEVTGKSPETFVDLVNLIIFPHCKHVVKTKSGPPAVHVVEIIHVSHLQFPFGVV